MYPTPSMCLTLSRCHMNIPVTPGSCFVDCLDLRKEKGVVIYLPPPLLPPSHPQSLLHLRGLPRLFFLLPAHGRIGMISPWPLNLCTPEQCPSVLSITTSGTLLAFPRYWHPEGFWICQGHRAFPFQIAHATRSIPAAQRVVISEAAMSVLKITYLPLRGEYSVYQLECVPAELITAQHSVSQWFVLSFIICVTQQCGGEGKGSPPSLSLYPFCVENLYLLWECNLFLMDNVTLSGAGSWVSWSDIFR